MNGLDEQLFRQRDLDILNFSPHRSNQWHNAIHEKSFFAIHHPTDDYHSVLRGLRDMFTYYVKDFIKHCGKKWLLKNTGMAFREVNRKK